MPKLTKAEFDLQNTDTSSNEISQRDQKALITRVYNWQQREGVYAWDEEALQKDLGFSISGFILEGINSKGKLIEVQFFQPLDENVDYEGVACGFRLIMLQSKYYNLEKYPNPIEKDLIETDETNEKGV